MIPIHVLTSTSDLFVSPFVTIISHPIEKSIAGAWLPRSSFLGDASGPVILWRDLAESMKSDKIGGPVPRAGGPEGHPPLPPSANPPRGKSKDLSRSPVRRAAHKNPEGSGPMFPVLRY